MKTHFKNHAAHFAMLLMALAMAFTISCENKEEKQAKAEASEPLPKTEAECPSKKIGSPKTVEAVFLRSDTGELGDFFADFRLGNGKDLRFFRFNSELNVTKLKEGDKVSITYQEMRSWESATSEYEASCVQADVLQSMKILPK